MLYIMQSISYPPIINQGIEKKKLSPRTLSLGLVVPWKLNGMSAEQRGFIRSVSTDLGCWSALQWSETNLYTSGTPVHGLTELPCNLWALSIAVGERLRHHLARKSSYYKYNTRWLNSCNAIYSSRGLQMNERF